MTNENLGPDERDRDLIDGSWEDEYYGSRKRDRDWSAIQMGIVILVVAALVVPSILVFAQ